MIRSLSFRVCNSRRIPCCRLLSTSRGSLTSQLTVLTFILENTQKSLLTAGLLFAYSFVRLPVSSALGLPYSIRQADQQDPGLTTCGIARIPQSSPLRPSRVLLMANLGRWVKSMFARSASPQRRFLSSGSEMISGAAKFEEENWSWYKPGLFYPVRIGEVFQSRYKVVGKLGYGSHATVWLCRDLKWVRRSYQDHIPVSLNQGGNKYVALKICERESPTVRSELAAYNHLDTITTSNVGALLFRHRLDSFKTTGLKGQHECLVHEPLGLCIQTIRELSPGHKLCKDIVKVLLTHVLRALDFLHTDAEMIHTGINHFSRDFDL